MYGVAVWDVGDAWGEADVLDVCFGWTCLECRGCCSFDADRGVDWREVKERVVVRVVDDAVRRDGAVESVRRVDRVLVVSCCVWCSRGVGADRGGDLCDAQVERRNERL